MKKKLALLLAAIMLIAAIPMGSVFASTINTVTKVFSNLAKDDTLLAGNLGVDASFIKFELTNAYAVGDTVTLKLNNANWRYIYKATGATVFTPVANANLASATVFGKTADDVWYLTNAAVAASGIANLAALDTAIAGAAKVGGGAVGTYIAWRVVFSEITLSQAYLTIVNAQTGTPTSAAPHEIQVPLSFRVTAAEAVTLTTQTQTQTSAFTPITGSGLAISTVPGDTTVTVASKIVARETFAIDRITIKEKSFGTVTDGTAYILAPQGYKWVIGTDAPEVKAEPVGFGSVATSTLDISTNALGYFIDLGDGRGQNHYEMNQVMELTLPASVSSGTSKFAGTLYLYNLKLAVNDDENVAFEEDLVIKFVTADSVDVYEAISAGSGKLKPDNAPLSGTTNNIATTYAKAKRTNENLAKRVKDVVVAQRLDYGIDFALVKGEKVIDIYSGGDQSNTVAGPNYGHISGEILFSEKTPVSWWAENITNFEPVDKDGKSLKDKVKITRVQVTDYDNMKDITGTYDKLTSTENVKLYDDYFSISNTPIPDTELGWVTFKVWISAAADFEGEVYLMATGRGIPSSENNLKPLLFATVKSPIHVTTKTKSVEVGYMATAIEDITIEEDKAGLWGKGKNVELRVEAFGKLMQDIEFIDANNVKLEKVDGDGLLEKAYIDGLHLVIPVSRSSYKTPIKYTITGLKLYIDRSVPEGKYDLAVGGDAIRNNWQDGNAKLGIGMFRTYGKVIPEYVVVATPGVNKALSQNVVVNPNSKDVVIDKVAAQLNVEAFIDPTTSRYMVPIRFISMALGIEEKNVYWNDKEKKVTVITAERTVEFWANTSKIAINGAVQYMGTEANPVNTIIQNERTFIPFAYLASAYGITVAYNETTKQAVYNPSKEQLTTGGFVTVNNQVFQ